MLDLASIESRIKELAQEAEQLAIKHHGLVGAIAELNTIYLKLKSEAVEVVQSKDSHKAREAAKK